MSEIKELREKVDVLELMIQSNHQSANDQIQDLREERKDDAISLWLKKIGDSLDEYKEQIYKLKGTISNLKATITLEDLKEIKDKSGVPLKELAHFIGYDTENLSAISQLMCGKIQDENKRLKIYTYMLSKLNTQIEEGSL